MSKGDKRKKQPGLELLGSLIEDERVFAKVNDRLSRVEAAAKADGSHSLAAAVARLAAAFQRFDFERTAAVIEIVKYLEDGNDDRDLPR